MNIFFETYTQLAIVMFVYMSCWFLFSLYKKRNDFADIAWGLGFLLVTLISYVSFGTLFDRGLLVTLLVTFWALRLSIHIYLRNKNKGEDYRYQAWRDAWGKWFVIRSFLQVFILQGTFLLLIVSPVIFVLVYRGGSLTLFDIVGVMFWIIGFVFESVGDMQLKKFISNPDNKGKIMQTGLWKYTRHPNYFGEITQWWGLWVVALSIPFGFYTIIGPLTITFLILKVSGIPMLEKKYDDNIEFQEYKKRTSAFFPLPSKKI